MRKLINPDIAPPGGWRYIDPDTGFEFSRRYSSLYELIEHVRIYREQNHLEPLNNISFYVQDWLCKQPNVKRYCNMNHARTASQYIRGAKAAVKTAFRGEAAYEPQKIAEKRAEICVNCPHNKTNPRHSRLLKYSDRAIKEIVGNRKTSFDDKLFSCEVCSCPLRSKVHIAQNIIEESLSIKERRELESNFLGLDGNSIFCWQLHPIRNK